MTLTEYLILGLIIFIFGLIYGIIDYHDYLDEKRYKKRK